MKKIFLTIVAIAIALTSTVAKAQEPTTPEQIFEFLNHKLAGNYSTSVEPNKLDTDDEIFFEDGSWRFHEYTGCLDNWDCDENPDYVDHAGLCTYLDEIIYEDLMEYDRTDFNCKNDPRVTSTNYELVGIIRLSSEVEFTFVNYDIYEFHVWLPMIIH